MALEGSCSVQIIGSQAERDHALRQERERHAWGIASPIQLRHSSWQGNTHYHAGHCIKGRQSRVERLEPAAMTTWEKTRTSTKAVAVGLEEGRWASEESGGWHLWIYVINYRGTMKKSRRTNLGNCVEGSAVHWIRKGSWSHVLLGREAEVAGKPAERKWMWKGR